MEKCEVRRFMPHEIMELEILDETTLFVRAEAFDALKAENELLKTQCDATFSKAEKFMVEASRLEHENQRLRAALEKIENKTIWNNNSLEQDFHEANEIAREALASGWDGGK